MIGAAGGRLACCIGTCQIHPNPVNVMPTQVPRYLSRYLGTKYLGKY